MKLTVISRPVGFYNIFIAAKKRKASQIYEAPFLIDVQEKHQKDEYNYHGCSEKRRRFCGH